MVNINRNRVLKKKSCNSPDPLTCLVGGVRNFAFVEGKVKFPIIAWNVSVWLALQCFSMCLMRGANVGNINKSPIVEENFHPWDISILKWMVVNFFNSFFFLFSLPRFVSSCSLLYHTSRCRRLWMTAATIPQPPQFSLPPFLLCLYCPHNYSKTHFLFQWLSDMISRDLGFGTMLILSRW